MSQPGVEIPEQDGGLGILPSGTKPLALVGVSTSGTVATPVAFGSKSAILAYLTSGPLCVAAVDALERTGRPVVVCPATAAVAGTPGDLVDGVTGTSVVTLNEDAEPNDDYEIKFLVTTGGTIGVSGIKFKYSLDGGRTYSPIQALGTANTYAIPGAGTDVELEFAAGTLVVNDYVTLVTFAPNFDATSLNAAIAALGASTQPWRICEIVGALDGTTFDTVESAFLALKNKGKERGWIGHARMPNANTGESNATYQSSIGTVFAAKATTCGCLTAGSCEYTSATGRVFRRPVSFPIAAAQALLSEEQNLAEPGLGPLVGVSLTDTLGNPKHHNESNTPGLDDARFTVLRTWEDFQGVYVNKMRCFSAAGSDFELFTHRLVMSIAKEALRRFLTLRCNKPIVVDATTGFILETEALEIEAGANAILRGVLLNKPKASAASFKLSRTDNLLSTKTLTGNASIVPLAYPENISAPIQFTNPALSVVTA